MSVIEKVIICVVPDALGDPKVKAGDFPHIDKLAKRGSCGFLATFADSNDLVNQLTGAHYHGVSSLEKVLGKMDLAVLKTTSAYGTKSDSEDDSESDGFGVVVNRSDDFLSQIDEMIHAHQVVIVELDNIQQADDVCNKFLPSIDTENIALCIVAQYKQGHCPSIPIPPPCVHPSFKIVGPNVVESLTVDNVCLFLHASRRLTRIDHVQSFDETDIHENCCLGCMPICQLLREFSYYTGSSWKFGA